MAQVLLKTGDAAGAIDVSLERAGNSGDDKFTASIGKKKIDVRIESMENGRGSLRIGATSVPFHVVRSDETVYVWIRGRTYRFELVERKARRASGIATVSARSELTAPMPGTVLKVLVAAGQSFEAHAPLVVMESMKMEMTLSEPHAGRVKEIACRPGQLVPMGSVLMRFEEKNDGAAR
jgi:3-methylcrotonyl-CoA carboxylase alpha subunit